MAHSLQLWERTFFPGPAAPILVAKDYADMLITEEELVRVCQKMIGNHEQYMREMRKDDVRRKRRVVSPHQATLLKPSYWKIDSGFDPYHVRSSAKSIVRAVNLALRNGNYRPRAPISHSVQKLNGENRILSIFQIVDALISKKLFDSLMEKNRTLMSARSYAYRSDLSTHDAIQYISSEFRTVERIFIAEYDFSKFFDTISHEHIWGTIRKYDYLITPKERYLVQTFITSTLEPEASYTGINATNKSEKGLPQGTSISLFLANVAASDIDRSLERIGVSFVRYADDTLIWSRNYGQISESVNILKRASEDIGSSLNQKKSEGVRLFTPAGEPSEIRSTHIVNFVGYKFSRGKIGLREEVINRMKKRINHLVWANLLQSLQQGTFDEDRVSGSIDRDYAVLVLQLRRYLYGNLTEAKVRELERSEVRRIRYPGILSYFPLINDQEQLGAFDGWLIATVHQALKKRKNLIQQAGYYTNAMPLGLDKLQLLDAMGTSSAGTRIDLRIPSVARFASIILRAANQFGANAVGRGVGAEAYQYAFGGNSPRP